MRRGDRTVKCAAWCGRGCTLGEYRVAVVAARRLAARLGPGWKVDVFENMGWHFSVVSRCDRMKVHQDGGTFTAYFGEPGPGGRWVAAAKTPRRAVARVVRAARRDLRRLKAIVRWP